MIDRYLFRESKQKELGRYYPSEIGGCLRKVWFSYKQPKETPKELKRIFEAGNIMHDFVAKVLQSEKNPEVELIQSEVPFKVDNLGFVISGRIDDLLLVKKEDKKVLVEVKSCKSLHYVDKPSPSYVSQLQFYMWALRIHDGVILYVEKNTLNSKVFTIPYDEKHAQDILGRFKKLDERLREDRLPEPEAKMDRELNWMCRFCDWKKECDLAQ
jgi:CRISPR/Cas system-associated exonuclease Cas4 (RecB family)